MSNDDKIELLAPAGGPEQLRAAINFGANAVYLAGQHFGMRAFAENFKNETLFENVNFAHDNGVKVYVTCNILMHDYDIQKLEQFLHHLVEAQVDAVIVGDIGAMATVKKFAPEIDIHISTQASVANTVAAIEYAKMGARRIILAREMSLEQIVELRQNLDAAGYADNPDNPKALALEAFVHGAMCMSVSGRCLISSYLTGRSANKGACTQPCRWGYNLTEEKRPGQNFKIAEDNFGTYIMNSMDLNMLAYLDKLRDAGISSIKIEGRNKKSLYVATVVNAYRHVLDTLIQHPEDFKKSVEKWDPELYNVSHRPYSTGFYFSQAKQSVDYDGYEQNTIHVGDVLACETRSTFFGLKKFYLLKVLCRNHFEEGQVLEALVPGGDIISLTVENLKWYPDKKSGGKAVQVANRATQIYSFTINVPIKANSILRIKSHLRTSH